MAAEEQLPQSPSPTASPPRWRYGWKRWTFLGCLLLGAAAIGHMWYVGSHVDRHVYTVSELEAGPIAQIIAWDGGRTAVQISRLSSLSADDLWRVVTDQGRFNEFMPYVRSTSVRPGPDGASIVKQQLDLPHAKYELELEIRLREQDGVRTALWQQIRGALSFNQGAWVVESHGDRSLLRYQVSASLSWVPQWSFQMGGSTAPSSRPLWSR